VSYEDEKSMSNSRVPNLYRAMRRGSAEKEMRKHWACVTGAWKIIANSHDELITVSYGPSDSSTTGHGSIKKHS